MTSASLGVALVIAAGLVEGVAQVFFKKSALEAARRWRWLAPGIALFSVQAVLYTGGLQLVEVSTAFPATSVGFAMVALLSRRVLGEPVTRSRWIGIGLIVAGVALLALQA